MPWTAPNQVHIVAWAGWEVCDGAHRMIVMNRESLSLPLRIKAAGSYADQTAIAELR
jgi:hypothetical protein